MVQIGDYAWKLLEGLRSVPQVILRVISTAKRAR
jgi:hypothetical protein